MGINNSLILMWSRCCGARRKAVRIRRGLGPCYRIRVAACSRPSRPSLRRPWRAGLDGRCARRFTVAPHPSAFGAAGSARGEAAGQPRAPQNPSEAAVW